ncbi:MAG: hypothetical protein ABIN58_10690 [candidate division WOR-3 bacterium]
MGDQECEFEVDLHRVCKVAEVRSYQAANDLLAEGWILHEVYVSGDGHSNFILLRLTPLQCPRCGGPADIEITDEGEAYRYVCQRECL